MSTNVRDQNKIPNYLATGRKNGHCSGFEYISQAKEQLNDSGHVSRFSFHHLHSVSNKVEQNFVSELFFLSDISFHV